MVLIMLDCQPKFIHQIINELFLCSITAHKWPNLLIYLSKIIVDLLRLPILYAEAIDIVGQSVMVQITLILLIYNNILNVGKMRNKPIQH